MITNDKTVKNGNNNSIKTKATSFSIIVFLIYLLILPTFGVGIDYVESIIFYSIPLCLYAYLLFSNVKIKSHTTNPDLFFQTLLIVLFGVSTFFSQNIGMSYYFFWVFVNVIFITNIASSIIVNFKQLFKYLIWISLLYCFVFIMQKIGIITLPVKDFGDNFILQVFGHSYLGNFLIFPIIVYIYQLKPTLSKLFPLVLFVSTLILSNSRSAIFGLIIGLIYLRVPYKKVILGTLIVGISYLFYQSTTQKQFYKSLTGSRLEYFRQAIIGIKQSPIIGNGPNTFNIINRQNKVYGSVSSNTSHNSLLDFASGSGLIFTTILLVYICRNLLYQYHHNRLLFSLSIAIFCSSQIDSFWGNPGLLTLSLLFTLYRPQLSCKPKLMSRYLFILFLMLSIFFISKTSSDFLFFANKYKQSLLVDPFNLNSRLALLNDPAYLPTTLKLFNNEESVYRNLADTQHIFLLNPQDNIPALIVSLNQSVANKDGQQTKILSDLALKYLQPRLLPPNFTLRLSRTFYSEGANLWPSQNSLFYYKLARDFSPKWSQYNVVLANAYWHLDQKEAARKVLNDCLLIPTAKDHCQTYSSFESPSDPIWQKTINDIPIPALN